MFGSFPTLAKKRHEESELDRSEGERSKPEEGKITHARSCFGARKKNAHAEGFFFLRRGCELLVQEEVRGVLAGVWPFVD